MQGWHSLSRTAQDLIVAGFVCCAGVLLYAAELYAISPESAEPSIAVRIGVLALLCVATAFRRRAPIPALLGGLVPLGIDLLLGPTVPIWLIYTDLVYAAVLYASGRQSRAVVALSAVVSAAIVVIVGVRTGDWRDVAVAATFVFAFVVTPNWWASTVRTHKEIAAAERARAEALSTVAELDRQAAIVEERNTMARDLHDVIAGHLSAIAIQAEAALRTDPAAVPEILKSMRANSIDALDEMRAMIGLLQSKNATGETAAPSGLSQLPRLIESARAAGTITTVNGQVDQPVPTAVDHTAYRITQEALTNAMKHAPGRPVEIDITADRSLQLAVSNPMSRNGTAGAGRGLANMRERTRLLGGTFAAGPENGKWLVRVALPLDEQ